MYIFKCKCGCFFTVKSFRRGAIEHPKCQNCGAYINIYDQIQQDELADALDKAGMTMQLIPDNAKLTITFEP